MPQAGNSACGFYLKEVYFLKEKKDFFHTVYDCVIENGTVIDPKTELRTIGNVAILNGKIAGVTRARLSAKRKIDASGKIVCPGIVDPHSHADGQLFSGYVMASMGVTTIIVGSCGLGPYPVKEFLTGLDETGYPLNTAALTPQSWILREKAGIESPYHTATKEQIQNMARWAEEDLLQGAVGLSMGLEYAPVTTWEEMVAMAEVAAKYDKVMPIHSRAGGWNSLEATREVIRLQETTGVRVLLSHHVYQCGQGMMEESLKIIEKARRQGYQIAVDSGAYCDFACPVGSEVFCEGWQQIYDCSYEDILAGTGKYAGQRLTEETFHELRETDPDASVTAFVGKPYEIALALKQPYVMISTDGGFPNLAPGIGHPQTAGTYPRILRELVREQDVLTVMDFVKKSSWMPAQFFGLETKGFIGEGADADILVFDLKRVKDNATFPGMGDPMAQPDGIDYVLVGGVPVVDNGIIQKDAKPGKSIFSRTEIWQM